MLRTVWRAVEVPPGITPSIECSSVVVLKVLETVGEVVVERSKSQIGEQDRSERMVKRVLVEVGN